MRRHVFAAVAAVAAASCASLPQLGTAPYTPMTVADWPGAPEGPFRAGDGQRILTQHLTPALAVTLADEARPVGLRAPAAAAAGTALFGVVDAAGEVRYCAPARAGILSCFEDVDGDFVFDRSWSAAAHEGFSMSVRRWTGRSALAAPARYAAADPLAGPRQQIAIRYLGRAGGRLGFALQVGGPDGFSDVAWSSRAAWIAPASDGTVAFAGARLSVMDSSRHSLIYRLNAAMTRQPVTLQVSTASRTLDSLVVLETPSA